VQAVEPQVDAPAVETEQPAENDPAQDTVVDMPLMP
jgi:hypothetical protein